MRWGLLPGLLVAIIMSSTGSGCGRATESDDYRQRRHCRAWEDGDGEAADRASVRFALGAGLVLRATAPRVVRSRSCVWMLRPGDFRVEIWNCGDRPVLFSPGGSLFLAVRRLSEPGRDCTSFLLLPGLRAEFVGSVYLADDMVYLRPGDPATTLIPGAWTRTDGLDLTGPCAAAGRYEVVIGAQRSPATRFVPPSSRDRTGTDTWARVPGARVYEDELGKPVWLDLPLAALVEVFGTAEVWGVRESDLAGTGTSAPLFVEVTVADEPCDER